MALINCPECAREVSDKAVSCPQCGFPIAGQSTETLVVLPETVQCLDCKYPVPFMDEVCPQCGLFNSQKYKLISPPEEEPEPVRDELRCPVCGSTHYTADKKGYGLGKGLFGRLLFGVEGYVAGAAGANAIEITCLKCGKKWKPGERKPEYLIPTDVRNWPYK